MIAQLSSTLLDVAPAPRLGLLCIGIIVGVLIGAIIAGRRP